MLISADYSQIELRVLAHLAGEDALIEAFRGGEDIHDRTALKVFGADSGLGQHELRRRAKIINYALLYGKTAFTLAKDIGVTKEAAQTFIDAYFAGFPKVRGYIDATVEEARRTGVVKTMFGRRRLRARVEQPQRPDPHGRRARHDQHADPGHRGRHPQARDDRHPRRARAIRRHVRRRTRMILTVHDELVFEAPKEQAEAASAQVKELMQNAVALAVPLDVDVGYADNWRDAKASRRRA